MCVREQFHCIYSFETYNNITEKTKNCEVSRAYIIHH
jgi:hypothetical protein